MTKLPVVKEARARGGATAFTDGGAAPRWVTAARVVMLLALAATIPAVLGLPHGNRVLWTVAIAALPMFWTVVGFHVWRRICPLAVIAQTGRLLGRPGTRKAGEWIAANYLLVQLVLMIACLTLRLVATNGSDVWLAGFLGAIAACALVTSFIYGGKTWCNFLCPIGMVEKIHTEPVRSATSAVDAMTSQCAPCVACKKHCPDIDLEQGYWKEAGDGPRRIAYFAWPGVVVGFYVYFYLVSGGWDYYFTGAWAYERALPQLATGPGLWFATAVPRIVAAPLTLVAFGAASYALFAAIEAMARSAWRRGHPNATDDARAQAHARIRHVMLAIAGFVAFNAFYLFAGQPTLRRLPPWIVAGWNVAVVVASTAMLMRRIGRREDQYVHEKFAQKILKKWEWGDAPPSDKLADIYLVHAERTKQREARLRAYKETVREMVADGLVSRNELVLLDSLRGQLGVSDKDHQKILGELSAEERQLFDPAYQGSVEQRLTQQRYRGDLERLVTEAARAGMSPSPGTLAQLRTERSVSEVEEHAVLGELLAPGGPIAALYHGELAEISKLCDAMEAAAGGQSTSATESASLALLHHLAHRRATEHAVHALGILAVMTKRPEVEQVRDAAAARGRLESAQLEPLGGVAPALREPLAAHVARIGGHAKAPLAPGPMIAIAGDGSRHLRAAVAMLLSRFDDAPARAQLIALARDPDVIVREAAVRALGATRRLTRELIEQALADPEPQVRGAAVRALSGTTSGDLPAIDPAMLAQTIKGAGKSDLYATLDANALMTQLTAIERIMLIRQVPMFGALDADDLEQLGAIVDERRIESGATLFAEGDAGDAVYVIIKGAVRVFTGGSEGRPERTLSELGPGACIGEMAVLDAAPRSATVRATERVRALRVPGEGFKRVMSERPEISAAIVGELVRRMRSLM